jgi:sulfur carrier protein
MRLMVNGDSREVTGEQTVALLVATITAERRGVAVAVNGEVVPRSMWAEAGLHDGDRVEVLSAAQGG